MKSILCTYKDRALSLIFLVMLSACQIDLEQDDPTQKQLVDSTGIGTISLTWQIPTNSVDGQPISSLASFQIRYGTSPSNLDSTIDIGNPSISTYILDNTLAPGTYYFAVLAIDTAGRQSGLSQIISVDL